MVGESVAVSLVMRHCSVEGGRLFSAQSEVRGWVIRLRGVMEE